MRAYHETYGLPVTITNCSNNYGPCQFPEKVIPLFTTQALDDEELPLYESTANRRERLHVEDHCRAIELVLGAGRVGETYNVGSGVEASIVEIADLVLDAPGKPETLKTIVPDRPGHDRRYLLDSSKLRASSAGSPRSPSTRACGHCGLVRGEPRAGGSRSGTGPRWSRTRGQDPGRHEAPPRTDARPKTRTSRTMSDVAVIGAGYVGLTTAVCLAHLGHDVVCADIDEDRVERVNKGEVPILEDGLPELRARAWRRAGCASCSAPPNARASPTSSSSACRHPRATTAAADLSFVDAAAREIAPLLRPGHRRHQQVDDAGGLDQDGAARPPEAGAPPETVVVASNPEFLREGTAVRDFLHPNRVVIGCADAAVAVRVSELYKSLNAPILVTDPASAEMIKYASTRSSPRRSRSSTRSRTCAKRSTPTSARSRSGWATTSGSVSSSSTPVPGTADRASRRTRPRCSTRRENAGYDFSLLRGVVEVNHEQHERMVTSSLTSSAVRSTGATIAVWGLTFKANTDDLRDSPALVIVDRLIDEGATVRAYDPAAGERRPRSSRASRSGGPVRGVRRRRRCWPCHGVGRVPLDGLRPGRRDDADSDRARHAEHARPGRAAPPGLHLRRRRSVVTDHPRRRATDGPRPRAVVTGGAGFLGSHLSERLIAGGWDVVGLDNLLTGRIENLDGLLGREEFTFEHYDVTNSSTSPARSTRCCTSRARRARSTTSSTRSRP